MIEKVEIRSQRLRITFSFALLVILVVASYWYFFMRPEIESNDAYVEANIIPIMALTSGVVTKIGVDDSIFVHANQWLLSQEQHLTSTNLVKASASLATAVRQTRSQFSLVKQETAAIVTLRAQRTKFVSDLSRYLQAEAGGGVASQKVSDTRSDIAIIDSQIVAAQAALEKAQALVAGTTIHDNPAVQKEEASFIEAHIQNRRSILFSPVAGYVARRRVQVGQQVKEGQWLMAIVPLDYLWITANIKETGLAKIRTGEPVLIQAQVYGDDVDYHGHVVGIVPAGGSTFSLFPPDNTTGNYIHIVERVPVRISLDPDELKAHPLRPGMSVSVTIDTENYSDFKELSSNVSVSSPSFKTTIYEQELQSAKHAAQQIIENNIHTEVINRQTTIDKT